MKIFHTALFAFGILFLLFLPSRHTRGEKNYCQQSKLLIETSVEYYDSFKIFDLDEEDNDDIAQREVKSYLQESTSRQFNYNAVYHFVVGKASQKISIAPLPRYLILGIIRI